MSGIRKLWVILAGVLVLATPLLSQITIGNDLAMRLNGTVSAGYNGTYGNQIPSSHGLGFGGAAGLAGSFYSPNFFSFNVNPYYNQSRSNSDFGSVTNASGVSLSTAIFSGSHFPGSVNYAAAFNNTGNYGLPGISGLNTNGDSQTFGVGWGAFLPGLPTLNVGYQQGTQNYSIYGSNQTGSSNFHSFYLNSNYTLAGFNLGAGFSDGTSNALIPGVLINGQETTSTSDDKSLTFNASHRLPLNGSFSSSYSWTDLNSDYLGYKFNGTIDRVSATAGIQPTQKLYFSLSADYTDNLSGSLYQAIFPTSAGQAGTPQATTGSGTDAAAQAGGSGGSGSSTLQGTELNVSSHAWNVLFNTSYAFAKNLQANGEVERRMQSYAGANYSDTVYGGGLSYTRQILGGYMGANLNVFDSVIDGKNSNSLGYNANANYNRRIGAWQVGGYFNYAQNVQTILVTYNSSFYNFSGSVARRFGAFFWSANAGAGRIGIASQPGSDSSSENFSTSLGTSRISLTGTFSKSNGNALAGGNGLIPTPLPPIIPSNLLVFYGGQSLAVALSGSPIRHMTASLSYINARSNITNQGVGSSNKLEEENAYLTYQFRQIGFQGGYTKFNQGFSASGQPPASVSSFFIGIYRWFNFF